MPCLPSRYVYQYHLVCSKFFVSSVSRNARHIRQKRGDMRLLFIRPAKTMTIPTNGNGLASSGTITMAPSFVPITRLSEVCESSSICILPAASSARKSSKISTFNLLRVELVDASRWASPSSMQRVLLLKQYDQRRVTSSRRLTFSRTSIRLRRPRRNKSTLSEISEGARKRYCSLTSHGSMVLCYTAPTLSLLSRLLPSPSNVKSVCILGGGINTLCGFLM